MTRRTFLAGAASAAAAQRRPAKPNIVFILADDLGYGDLGCYGQQQIPTPNLDRMAQEGMRFTQAYAGSTVCAPSRCCLMTGYHTGHARTRGNQFPDLPLRPQDLTVAEILQQSGYRTGLFGKWSLGNLGSTGYPTRKGFDEWMGFFSQVHAHNYYPEHMLEGESALLLRGNMGMQRKDYAADLVTDYSLRFLESAASGSRPFFLHVCTTIPHANNEMGRDTGNGMEVPSDAPFSDRNWPQPEKNFAAMVTRLDRDVGRLLDQLRKSGLAENTLVLFSSDNGPHREGGHDPNFFQSSGPLRGIKRDLYEGGIRVPTLAWWPGTIQPGSVSQHIWAFWDFLPTAAELAGAPVPKNIDGLSFANALRGRPQAKHDYLYWEFHERQFAQAVRWGDWKAVRKKGQALELYNLSTDLGETLNVAGQQADVVRRMEDILARARTESAEFPVS